MKTEDIRNMTGADAMRQVDDLVGRGEGYLTAGEPNDTTRSRSRTERGPATRSDEHLRSPGGKGQGKSSTRPRDISHREPREKRLGQFPAQGGADSSSVQGEPLPICITTPPEFPAAFPSSAVFPRSSEGWNLHIPAPKRA